MEYYRTRTPRRAAAPSPRPAADDTYPGRGGGRSGGQGAGGAARGARPAARGGERGAARRGAGRGGLRGAAAALRDRPVTLPSARLTALGAGLLTALAMLAFGCLDAMLLSGSHTAYGVFFLLACTGCGMWVRPADLFPGAIGVPIAFTAGLLPINDGSEGFAGQALGVFTALSLNAGWLYAGTLLTAVIVLVRRIALMGRQRRRRQQRQPRPSRHPRSPRCSAAAPGRSRP
ncbi:DUF6542 domain-containing protein [Streptomyces sp. NPDC019937]|uniref:DUF6542 domain-containing protein n=1 Tax=Streptomyces sp. NPDC019937 TaxID=3154787 RepID=UPI003400995B